MRSVLHDKYIYEPSGPNHMGTYSAQCNCLPRFWDRGTAMWNAALVVFHVMERWKRRNTEDRVPLYSVFVTSCCGIVCVKLCFVPSSQQSFCLFDSLFNNDLLLALTSRGSLNIFADIFKHASKSCSCAWVYESLHRGSVRFCRL
jgi:hypothetical protein